MRVSTAIVNQRESAFMAPLLIVPPPLLQSSLNLECCEDNSMRTLGGVGRRQ